MLNSPSPVNFVHIKRIAPACYEARLKFQNVVLKGGPLYFILKNFVKGDRSMYFKISVVVSAFLLYAAFIGFHSYGPYNILRTVVCLFSAYSAYRLYEKSETFAWIFAIMAIIINPIIKIHLSKSTWSLVDVVFAGIILFSAWIFKSED